MNVENLILITCIHEQIVPNYAAIPHYIPYFLDKMFIPPVDPVLSGFLFKAVVQAVLIFLSETWVVTPHMGRDLGGFQDQVERWLTGRIPRQKTDGEWRYTLVEAAKEEAGFQ